MLKIVIIFTIAFTTKLDAIPKATNHSFMLTKGRETLAAIGLTHSEVSLGKLKHILESCIRSTHDPLSVAYAIMNEAQQSTFTGRGFASRVANIYRALKAIDREHGKDYAHDFLELAVEKDRLDLDLLYRYTYWLSIIDFVLPSHNKKTPQEGLAASEFKIHFYEQSNAKPITEEAVNLANRKKFYKFFNVKKNTNTLIEKGFLDNFGHLANKARRHYSLPPEEEEAFNALVESLQAYSDKNKQRQQGKLSNSDAATRRDALNSILAKDPDESLVRHEATLSGFATQDFVQGRKPLRMRTLSRLYSLVEKFRGNAATYQELRWQYLWVYKQSLKLSPKSKVTDLAEDNLSIYSSPEKGGDDNYQTQLLDDSDLYLEDGTGLLTEAQIQHLHSAPEPQKRQQNTLKVRDHPSLDQIKRHSYFEDIIDAVVDERLKNYGSSYPSAREYIIRNGSSVFGLNAKERNAYIYEGNISQASVDKLNDKLKDVTLNDEQSKALERIAQQIAPKTSDAARFTTTTIKLIEKAIKITNQVYNENDNKIALFQKIKLWSDFRRQLTVGAVEAETIAKLDATISDLQQKVTGNDAKVLKQLMEKLESL